VSPAVDLRDVTVRHGSLTALSEITAVIPARTATAIIGPNGSGKTTLVKAILGLLPLQTGRVRLLGRSLEDVRHQVAYVPQREEIDWHFPLLVREAVAMGRLRPADLWRLNGRDRQIIGHAIEAVGLSHLADRPIGHLSGGERQRVFLARALARQADLYFLDEPLSGVDARTEEAILEMVGRIKERGKTVVCVHHRLDNIRSVFDWALILNQSLVACGPAREVFTSGAIRRAYRWPLPPVGEMERVKDHA